MKDLIIRLTAAIDAFEAGSGAKDDPSGHCDDLNGRHLDHDDILRWCAADRKILAEHTTLHTVADGFCVEEGGDCTHAGEEECQVCTLSPCPTLLALAERYEVQP